MKKTSIFFVLLLLISISLSLGKNGYVVTLPEGKLPWPHHRRDLTQSQYDDLIKNLWILNNYGQYQASEDQSNLYFHDGLDIMLDNGTKLYAVKSGYVKDINYNTTTNQGWIIIGDTKGDQPGYGWMYAHVNNFQFLVGDYVNQGDYIADVYFDGLEHVHLGKIFVENISWGSHTGWNYVHPNRYFIYEDTEPPVIKAPFYYFRNEENNLLFDRINDIPLVWGDVDIVVGIREVGEYAHSKSSGFGDRLCAARIEYEIVGNTTPPVYKKSFDFTKMIISNWEQEGRERTSTVFKHYTLFHDTIDSSFWDKTFSYYIITNTPGTEETDELKKVDITQDQLAWNTAELDEHGNPRFPNGIYTIIVTAYDFKGNSSSASDSVLVKNLKKKGKIRR